jgi:hypothetical protein
MKHIGLARAAFALGLLGSPLAAQEMAPPPSAAGQLPPPPPFPPMPSSKPSHRTVNLGGHPSSRSHATKSTAHNSRPAKHQVRSTKHRVETSKRAQASKRAHSSKRAVHSSAHQDKPLHFSKKTIRQCHGMTYSQIMRHSSCQALMKQELAAAPAAKHRTSHKASAKHKAATRSKTSRSHSTAKKRRR